jgi:hypothetical protein
MPETQTITNPTGNDLILHWHLANHYNQSRMCQGCQVDCSRVALIKLAYVFRVCECGTPEYSHLIEQIWHRTCLQKEA